VLELPGRTEEFSPTAVVDPHAVIHGVEVSALFGASMSPTAFFLVRPLLIGLWAYKRYVHSRASFVIAVVRTNSRFLPLFLLHFKLFF